MRVSDGPHAVRWCVREYRDPGRVAVMSLWHWTLYGDETLCKKPIPIAGMGLRFLPQTSDDLMVVDCKRCLKRLEKMGGHL